MNHLKYFFVGLFFTLSGCGGSDPGISEISIISATLNGSSIPGTFANVSTTSNITITFDGELSPSDFEKAISITSDSGNEEFQVTYRNATSGARIDLDLDHSTTYTFNIGQVPIGADGQALSSPFNVQFTTMEDDVIRSTDPCTSASADCLQTVELSTDEGAASFSFFSNYPIYSENAEWENLTSAIILVHGVNRNSDDYFNWMNATFSDVGVQESTILIAPSFKISSEAEIGELAWSGSNWREGADATNFSIGSFAVVDSIISQLAKDDVFPALEQIIVTGHSSGGLFAHAYAASNTSEINQSNLSFKYIIANSQYFYYPDGKRINESNDQLYTPSNCALYMNWPLGAESTVPYLESISTETLNDQFVSRSIIYLLGNSNDADPSLNTTDCSATLLGSTRFSRGENMFQYMELSYPGEHNHSKSIVDGVGHDGQGMYQSDEFKTLLSDLLPQ